MCRFAIYMGDPIVLSQFVCRPSHSIIFQSFGSTERSTPLNGDGFGISWYVPDIRPEPAMFKSISPAWNNRNLKNLCEVTTSPCAVTHVRAASPGSIVSEENCHPFCWNEITFVHNGDVGCFKLIKKEIVHLLSEESFLLVLGSTDSEHIFALFVDQYKKRIDDDNRIVNALKDTLSILKSLVAPYLDHHECTLNIGITNGKEVVASRFTTSKNLLTLYYCPKVTMSHCPTDDCEEVMKHGAMLASEPLGHDRSNWREIPRNNIIQIFKDQSVVFHPLEQ